MKKIYFLVFSLFSIASFSQSVNNYEFLIIPTKFEFQRTENQYRINTILKFRLEEYGFKAFYTSEKLSSNFNDKCLYLNANVVDLSGIFTTKLYIEFNDCNNAIIFKSAIGTSRTKDRKIAYGEALEEALVSVKNLNYNFEGKKDEKKVELVNSDKSQVLHTRESRNANSLCAQSIVNGFQLIDTTSKVVLKMFKTSEADFYIAVSEGKYGIIFKKENEWFFEYYVNEKLISEKLSIKF